jgi:hypothetical protein
MKLRAELQTCRERTGRAASGGGELFFTSANV